MYLIEEEGHLFVIDGPDGGQDTVAALTAFGKPIIVILTHGPTSGGVLNLKRALAVPVTVYLHEEDRLNPWLTINPEECTLWSGNKLQLSSNMAAIHTPGHSPGHACVYYRFNGGMLFTGDAVQGDATGNIADIYEPGTDWNTPRNLESLRLLAEEFAFEMILPFHYCVIRTDARKKLKDALNKQQ